MRDELRPTRQQIVLAAGAIASYAIGYPVAIYMSWRFYVEWRATESKVCPRCAERVKVAALVCRHCGQELEASVTKPAATTPA